MLLSTWLRVIVRTLALSISIVTWLFCVNHNLPQQRDLSAMILWGQFLSLRTSCKRREFMQLVRARVVVVVPWPYMRTWPALMGGLEQKLASCFLRNSMAVSGDDATMHCACPRRRDMREPYSLASSAKFWWGKALSKCRDPSRGSPVGPGGRLIAGLLSTMILSRMMTNTVVANTCKMVPGCCQ